MAAISYDSSAILRDFAQRHHITFPLLADPESRIIRRFGVLNPHAEGFTKGRAYPGFFVLTPSGVVREKFFESADQLRYTANNLVARLFPELTEEVERTVAAPHLQLSLAQSDAAAGPGSRLTLLAHLRLPDQVHVYAPGVEHYIPLQLALDNAPGYELRPAVYPQARMLSLPVIHETVPVFEGRFTVAQDVVLALESNVVAPGETKTLVIRGHLTYQACDQRECFAPASVPVNWRVKVLPLDRARAPEAIQHRER